MAHALPRGCTEHKREVYLDTFLMFPTYLGPTTMLDAFLAA